MPCLFKASNPCAKGKSLTWNWTPIALMKPGKR
ncbi:UNVERIFIED_CONTAM: hypothetical protein GTU68_042215 [Idotea baltica]|nr:hypothetical protein [Idotea baltica]